MSVHEQHVEHSLLPSHRLADVLYFVAFAPDILTNQAWVGFSTLQALARPGTLLIFHTTAKIMRREKGDRGMHERDHLGRHGTIRACA